MKFTYKLFKINLLYPIEDLPRVPHIGKCGRCSCPVIFSPIVQVQQDGKAFRILRFVTQDSKGNPHHCLKYKLL